MAKTTISIDEEHFVALLATKRDHQKVDRTIDWEQLIGAMHIHWLTDICGMSMQDIISEPEYAYYKEHDKDFFNVEPTENKTKNSNFKEAVKEKVKRVRTRGHEFIKGKTYDGLLFTGEIYCIGYNRHFVFEEIATKKRVVLNKCRMRKRMPSAENKKSLAEYNKQKQYREKNQ